MISRTYLKMAACALGLAAATTYCQAADAGTTNAPPKSPPWDTSATLGVTLTRGNSRTDLIAGNIQANKKWEQNEVNLGADAVYGDNNGVKNSEQLHGYGQYNRLFDEHLFGYLRLEGLHDAIADIKYRLAVNPGAGYYFIKNDRTTLRGEVGPGFVYERLGQKDRNYFTLRLAERGDHKLNERAKVWESVEILPQVDHFQNYVINSEIGIDTAITAKLSLTTYAQDTYRAEPAPGRQKNDLKLVAGVKYKF